MYRSLIALLCMTGCTVLPDLAPECAIDGLTVVGDRDVSCSNLAANLVLARQLAPELLLTEGVEVHVRDVDSLVNKPPFYVIGVYSTDESVLLHPIPQITLTHGGRGLLHELFHHLEKVRTGDANTNHVGWDENGFNEADQKYRHAALEVME